MGMSVRFTSNIGSFIDTFNAKARRSIEELLPECESVLKAECPVKTGFLRGTNYVRPKRIGLGVVWGATAPYSLWVHQGNGRSIPNPWIYRAMLIMEPRILSAIGKSMSL